MRIPLYYCIAGVALVTLLNLAVFEKVVLVLIDSESSPIRSLKSLVAIEFVSLSIGTFLDGRLVADP